MLLRHINTIGLPGDRRRPPRRRVRTDAGDRLHRGLRPRVEEQVIHQAARQGIPPRAMMLEVKKRFEMLYNFK